MHRRKKQDGEKEMEIPKFDPSPVQVEFVSANVGLGQIFL
jgi:hypothetical protein